MIHSGIVIDEPWVGMILNGDKTWEMRSTATSVRGQVALIRKGSGHIVGVASIKDCRGPFSRDEMLKNQKFHGIGEHLITSGKVDKWRYAWVLSDVLSLVEPIPYSHPKGAVIWVTLAAQTSEALSAVADTSKVTTIQRDAVPRPNSRNASPVGTSVLTVETEALRDRAEVAATDNRVPFAKDGSFFGRHLGERGYYQVGAKGEETKYLKYEEALSALRAMKTARWRRPNSSGNWGIVSAAGWDEIN